jgi:hypothetical protein
MAAEPERTFAGAKLIITDIRNQLGILMIQALTCLRSWYKIKNWYKLDGELVFRSMGVGI